MSRVRRRATRDVDPAEVADLLDDAPRAHLAFVAGGRAEVLPVVTRRRGGEQLVGVPPGAPPLAGREVHLVRDDGRYWFELRALALRGVLRPSDVGAVPGVTGLHWYVVDPSRTVAWDYGALREAPDA